MGFTQKTELAVITAFRFISISEIKPPQRLYALKRSGREIKKGSMPLAESQRSQRERTVFGGLGPENEKIAGLISFCLISSQESNPTQRLRVLERSGREIKKRSMPIAESQRSQREKTVFGGLGPENKPEMRVSLLSE